jgi:hypothetical protein
MSNDLEEREDGKQEPEKFPWQFLLFLVCSVIAVPVYFALGSIQTETLYNRHTFYIILEIASYVVIILTLVFIILIRLMAKRKSGESASVKIFVFYRNMNRWAYAWIGLGVGSVLGLEYFVMPLLDAFLETTISFSLLLDIVPSFPPNLPPALAWVPQPVANIVQQLLWQILSVGHSEEIFKVMMIVVGVAVFRKGWKVWIVMIVADVVWSCAHAMVAYGGNLAAIALALIVGAVFLVQLVKTKCVMVPAITHGWVNTILLVPSMGFTWTSFTQPITMTPILSLLAVSWTPALLVLISPNRIIRIIAEIRAYSSRHSEGYVKWLS